MQANWGPFAERMAVKFKESVENGSMLSTGGLIDAIRRDEAENAHRMETMIKARRGDPGIPPEKRLYHAVAGWS